MSTEDDIEASRAPLLEHLIELRARLIRSLAAFIVMFVISFAFAKEIYNLLIFPYVMAAGDGVQIKLIYTAPLEYLFTQIKIAVFGASFFSFPVIATQIYKFVAPGLYRDEKDAFRPYLIATPVLFLVGASVVFFVAMPVVMQFSIGMQQAAGENSAAIELLPKVSEYLSLIMTLIFAFGPRIVPKLRTLFHIGPVALLTIQFVVGIYGGYFGGAMGIVMLAVYSLFGLSNLNAMNATKALMAGLINGISVVLFAAAGKVVWPQTITMLIAASLGGYFGARVARGMNPMHVRAGIIAISVTVTAVFFVRLIF